MGIESFFRKVCEELCADAFYPQKKCEWPDTKDVKVMIDDVNSRIRAYPLCMTSDSELLSYGIKTWLGVLERLEAEYLKFFSQGITTIVVTFDGKCPVAKEVEQNKRKKTYEDRIQKEHIILHEWPAVTDIESEEFRSQRWFRDADRPAMGFNDIYYHRPSKIQWINYITEFLLSRMPIPTDCKIIVDSGVFKNVVMTKPICTYLEWEGLPIRTPETGEPFEIENYADYGATPTPGDEKNPKCWRRRIEEMPEQPDYWTYTEADDRLIFWVYHFATYGIIVCSEDGDTMLSLMATYRSRAEALGPGVKRLYLRRMDRIGTLIDRTPVKQPQIMDINRLADCIHTFFGGLLASGVQRILHQLPESFELDGVLFFSLLVLMRPNDYSEGFTGLGPLNLFRAAIARPDLCAKMFICETHDQDLDDTDKFNCPTTVMIQAAPFKSFVHAAYKQAYMLRTRADGHKRPDIFEKRFPKPDNDSINAVAARISWTLNKLCNGGRPEYKIPSELKREKGTELSIFGYEAKDIETENKDTVDTTDVTASATVVVINKKKRLIQRTNRVCKRTYYGERHVGKTVLPEGGLGLSDTVGDREAQQKEWRIAEQNAQDAKEKEERKKEKARENYQLKKKKNASLGGGTPNKGHGKNKSTGTYGEIVDGGPVYSEWDRLPPPARLNDSYY